MDLSNYQLIQAEVKRVRNISQEDREDLAQDIYVKLLESGATHITRKYVRRLVRNMLIDRRRRADRRPAVVFNSYLAERVIERGGDDEL